MLLQIGDIGLRFSKIAIAYKCAVFCLALAAFAYGGAQSLYPGVSSHRDPFSSLRVDPQAVP